MAKRSYVTRTTAPTEEEKEADFDLSGVGQVTGEPWREEFHLLPIAPVGCVDDLLSSMRITGDGRISYQQGPLVRFFRGVMLDADVARWETLIRDKDRAVDLQTLGEIMDDLSESMLGLPTKPPSSSASGRRHANGSSSDGSSKTASKPKNRPRATNRPASSGG